MGFGLVHSFEMTIRDTLAENFRKLRDATPSLDSPKDLVKADAASNGTIGRIAAKKTGVSIDKLEQLATAYGVDVWQMLCPTLRAEKTKFGKPAVSTGHENPFPGIDPQRFSRISYEQRLELQGIVRRELDKFDDMNASDLKNGSTNS